MQFLNELASRNPALYYFGWISLVGALIMLLLIIATSNQVLGINAYIKPFKFFMSTTIFVWSIAWYVHYLNMSGLERWYSWTVILVLGFELFWITFKATQGELSHFNVSSAFNGIMFFAFQGGIMGAQLSHTVGGPDGGPGLPLLNWSTVLGDYRVAHFAGMHALQILPIAGYYLFTNTRTLAIFSVVYIGICFLVFIQAMMKLPLIKM